MKEEIKRYWAEAAQRILGHEVAFAGPKGKATCHCAGASATPGLRWCKAEWPRRRVRLCTGVGGECRVVRPESLTETEFGRIVAGPDEDSEAAKAGEDGIRKRPFVYVVQTDGKESEVYSAMARAVSVLPEHKRDTAVESLRSTGEWSERGQDSLKSVSIRRLRLK